MAVSGKKSEGVVARKMFTGIAEATIIALNPNASQLVKLGLKAEEDPNYLTEKEGVKGIRLEFLLKVTVGNETIITRRKIWIKNQKIEALWIDNYAKFAGDPSKVDDNSARRPYDGEVDLICWLQAVLNHQKGEEFYLEAMEKLAAKGDIKELTSILQGPNVNTIQVLLGVDQGKYQVVYDKQTLRNWSTKYEYLHGDLVKNTQKGYVKEYFGPINLHQYHAADFRLRPYDPSAEFAHEATYASLAGGGQAVKTPAPMHNQLYGATVVRDNPSHLLGENNDIDDLPF